MALSQPYCCVTIALHLTKPTLALLSFPMSVLSPTHLSIDCQAALIASLYSYTESQIVLLPSFASLRSSLPRLSPSLTPSSVPFSAYSYRVPLRVVSVLVEGGDAMGVTDVAEEEGVLQGRF